ncbi:MAG TPA: thermonuclease family protein, partial [Ardenticatenaceae bacterium]|nr:thermonuclease family protein [Ardenticatenaceae bacterium]
GVDGSERYVFREDGTLVQAELVGAGYARLDPEDSGRYQEELQAVEQEARAARLGLWQYERAAPTPTSLTLSTASLPTLAAGRDEVTAVPFVCGPGAIAGGNALDVAGAEARRAARSATIVFQVVSTTEDGGDVSLYSGVPADEHFRVLIAAELHGSFPESPESFFAGRCIAASGRLQPYRRTTQLIVSEPADIYIVR